MKTFTQFFLAATLLFAACNKSNDANPQPASSDREAPDQASMTGDPIELTVTSGTALHVYLDVYYDDPQTKSYIDVNTGNYVSVLNTAFAYAKDLSNAKPSYCSSGDYKGMGYYVYVSVVCNQDLSVDDLVAKAIKIAPKYTYRDGNQKPEDDGIQQNFKLDK
jgi:hypothetical protein